MTPPFQDVVDLVNATLDGAELLARLQFVFASPSAFESDLDCGCLFTPSSPNIPLRIDLARTSCTCTRRFCPVVERNTLVELYAFARGRDVIAAALELAEISDVVIDDDSLGAIENHYLMLTQEALLLENVGMAGRCFLTALLVCPTAELARDRVREMISHLERPEDGAEFYLQFASYLELKGELREARRVIEEEVLYLQPYKPEYQARLASLQKELDPDSPSWSGTMFRVCDTLIAERRFEAAQRCLARISAVLPDLPQIHERMAETYLGMEMDMEATDEFLLACELHEKAGDQRSLVQLLERLVRENPDDLTYRRRSAEVRERASDWEGYARDVESLARHELKRQNPAAALGILEAAVTRVPNQLYIRETLAELLRSAGDRDGSAEHLLAAVDILLELELFERAVECVDLVSSNPPSRPDLLLRLGEALASVGQTEQAADRFLSHGAALAIAGEKEQAAGLLLRVGELVPLDRERIAKASAELKRIALDEEANALSLTHARALFDFGESEAALAVISSIETTSVDTLLAKFELEEQITELERGDMELSRLVLERLSSALAGARRLAAQERAIRYLEAHPSDGAAREEIPAHFLAAPDSPWAVPFLAGVAANPEAEIGKRIEAIAALLDRDDEGSREGQAMLPSFLEVMKGALSVEHFQTEAERLVSLALPSAQTLLVYAEILNDHGDASPAIRPILAKAADLDNDAALKLLNRIADYCPRDIELLDQLARREEGAGNLHQAMGCWRSIADLHQQRDNPEGENAACTEFLRLDPGNVEMLMRRARLHEDLGDDRRAVDLYLEIIPLLKTSAKNQQREELYRRILDLAPENTQALENLAILLEESGKPDEAAVLHLRRAMVATTNEGIGRAIELAASAAARFPHSRELRTLLIDLYAQAEDHSKLADAVCELADLHLEAGERNDLIVLLKTALIPILEAERHLLVEKILSRFEDVLATSPNLLRYRALALEGLDHPDEALQLWLEIAKLHHSGGRVADEVAALRRAIVLRPGDASLRLRILDALAAGGQGNQTQLVKEAQETVGLLDGPEHRTELEKVLRIILSIDHEDIAALEQFAPLMEETARGAEALESYIRLGRANSNSSNWQAARRALESALALDSWNVEALRLLRPVLEQLGDKEAYLETSANLASVLEQQGNELEALEVWEAIAQADPSNVESRIRLADACLERGNKEKAIFLMRELAGLCEDSDSPEEAIEMLRRLHQLDPEDPFTLEKLGLAHQRKGESEVALQHLRRAAEMLVAQKDLDSANVLLSRLLALHPRDLELHVMQAEVLLEMGHRSEASLHYERIADLCESIGELKESQQSRLRAIEIDPANLSARLSLAESLEKAGDQPGAAAQFLEMARLSGGLSADSHAHAEKAAALDPGNLEIALFLARSRTERKAPNAVEAWINAGRLQLAAGDPESARSTLQNALSSTPNSDVHMLLAELDKDAGEEDAAVRNYLKAADLAEKEHNKPRYGEAMAAAARLYPANTDILRKLGIYLRAEGKHDEGADWYLRAMEYTLEEGDVPLARHLLLDAGEVIGASDHLRHRAAEIFDEHELPELAARILMDIARDLYRDGRYEEALHQAESVLSLQPEDAAALQLRFTAARQTGGGDNLEIFGMALAQRYHQLSRTDEAAEVCRQVLDHDPESLPALEFLADIVEKEEDADETRAVLERLAAALEKRGEWPRVVTTLGRLHRIFPEDATTIRRRIQAAENAGQPETLCQDLMALADLLTAEGKADEAEELLSRVVEIDPSREDVQGKLITLHLSRGEIGPAVGLSYKLARACLDRGDSDTAQKTLERVREHLRDDPEFHMLLGSVHQMTRSRGLASREYMKALDLYRQRRDEEQVGILVGKLLELDPLNLEIRQLQVDRLLKANATEEAVEAMERLADACRERRLHDLAEAEYRRVLSLRPERYHLWKHVFEAHLEIGTEKELAEEFQHYATMLAADGKHREAADYFRRVVQNDPQSLRARIGFVQNYAKAGAPAEIIDEILELAQMLVDQGRVDESLEYFELATKADPKNQRARRLLSATQARSETEMRRRLAEGPGDDKKPLVDPGMFEEMEFSRTQLHMITDSIGPSDFLQDALEDLDRKENETTLSQIAEEYEDMLAMNPANGELRIKLADVYQQMNRISEMLKELDLASESLFKKGDLVRCVTACERFLKVRPDNAKMRKRLNEALLKHDALRALDSAILYDEDRPG